MEIVAAEREDAGEILALQKLAYRSEAELYDDFGIPPLRQTVEELEGQFEDHIILKAVQEDRIVGSVRAKRQGETCYIGRLIVHPDFWNQGVGTKLMAAIETCEPAERYEVFTGSKSERNLYLYKKLGYSEFRRAEETDKVTIVFLEKRKREDKEVRR